MVSMLFDAIVLAGTVSAFSLLVLTLRRFPMIAFSAVAINVFFLWEIPKPPLVVSLAGTQVYSSDIICAALFLVAIMNGKQVVKTIQHWITAWTLIGLLIAFSLLRGFAEFGLGASFNEARPVVWIFLAMTWALSVEWSTQDRRRIILILGWGLTAAAAYHALLYGVGSSASAIEVDGMARTGRILLASQAIILAVCGFMLALGAVQRSRFTAVSGILFLAVAVVSQHRSVWIAMSIAAIAVVLLAPGWAGRLRASVIAFGTLGASYVVATSGVFGELVRDIASSASDFRSLDARSTSWEQLVQGLFDEGLFAVLFGLPFGSGFVRIEPNGLVQTYSPHNWYVLLILRVGLLGLVAWSAVLVGIILLARKNSTSGFYTLVAFSAYAFFYTPSWLIAPLVGVSLMPMTRGGSDSGSRERKSHTPLPTREEGAPPARAS